MSFRTARAPSKPKPTALVVGKNAETHRSIHVVLGKEFDVHHSYFARLAISLLERRPFNVVITSVDVTEPSEASTFRKTIGDLSQAKGIPVMWLDAADDPSNLSTSVKRLLGTVGLSDVVPESDAPARAAA